MATTPPITGPTDADGLRGSGSGPARNASGTLGKDDFLKLLVGQMKNMDPMSAGGSDPSQSMAQMTQYSILEQLQNLSESNKQLAAQGELNSTIGLIGRTVSYSQDDGTPAEGVVEQVTTAGGNVSLTIGGKAGIEPGRVLEVR